MKDAIVWLPSDTHCGSTVGLMPRKWVLPDNGTYQHSTSQKVLWEKWIEDAELIKKERNKRRLIIVFMGDAIDGNHHNTTQIVSPNIEVHKAIHIAAMDEAMNITGFKKGDSLYYIAGTESHVARHEDSIARQWVNRKGGFLVPPVVQPSPENGYADGRFVRDHMLLNVNGVLFDLAHHPPVGAGTRAWTKGNAIRSMLRTIYLETAERSRTLPRYWIRSHRHQHVEEYHSGPYGTITGVLTPSYQTKTHFAYRVAADNLSHIGSVYCLVDGDGRSELKKSIAEYSDVEVEVA